MFDDKKLEKLIRQQVKVGLTIYVGGDEIAFVSPNWMARTTMERLTEKLRITLGTLVEMLGFIPGEGAIRIRKNKDGYDVQEEMQTVAAAQIGTFLDADLRPVKRTNIAYGWARQLWQTGDGKLYGQTADRVDTGGNSAYLNGADCLVLQDFNYTEEQYIKASRPEDDVGGVRSAMWRHLEEVMWTDWDVPTARENEPEEQIDGQTEIEPFDDTEETEDAEASEEIAE